MQRSGQTLEMPSIRSTLLLFRFASATHACNVACCTGVLLTMLIFTLAGCRSTGSSDHHDHPTTKQAYCIPTDLQSIPTLIENDDVFIDLIEVGPWYNRMPLIVDEDGKESPDAAGRRHLVTSIVFANKTEADMSIELIAACVSFGESELGAHVASGALSLIDEQGMPGGTMRTLIAPMSNKNVVRFRGEDLFDAGHENQMLYLTLVIRVNDTYYTLRRPGKVVVAM